MRYEEELELAISAARAAGERAMAYFQSTSLRVDRKEDGSFVTQADREAEALLRGRIAGAFPEDGILGEEEGEAGGSSGRTWILDPIDGTESFARGVPLFGTLVGLEVDGRVEVGVAYLPALAEMVYAARGAGATWVRSVGLPGETRSAAAVSRVAAIEEAMYCYTSSAGFSRAGQAAAHARLCRTCAKDRGWSDCYGHVLVATGRADIMFDPRMNVWDCAALAPVVEEAGGAFHDLRGVATHRGGSAISTNGLLAAAVERCLADAAESQPEAST